MVVLRSLLALIAGVFIGSAVNMALVMIGPNIIPPPEGVDVTDMASIAASMHLFEARHFAFPFLAHALGTLFGALVGFLLCLHYKVLVAYTIGVLSFAGGVAASRMIPAPITFIAIDLILAYIPMAWIAVRVGHAVERRRRSGGIV